MAASGKFDLASGSPDRPLYASGPRGSCAAASLDRAGSFREGVDSPILSSLPSMSRKSSIATSAEVTSFFQCLPFDPKFVAAEQRSHRLREFKRHATVVLGISTYDAPSVSLKGKHAVEDLKRFKSGLHECYMKAKERQKMFTDALSVLNKFFPSIPSRKRSRADVLSSERPNSLLSSDRSTVGADVGKMETKSHSISNSLELEQPKLEERTKSSIPNKRTRTSLLDPRMDVQANALARPSGAVDRERELLKVASHSAVQSEDRSVPIGVDGWEKSKMKKKRSGIKPDVSSGLGSTKLVDGNREPKMGMAQRVGPDARSRLSDSHGFRAGVANGVAGAGKMDGVSQQTGLGTRFSVPRNDLDSTSTINDRRDRPTAPDKERVNLRTVNKTSIHEDFSSASPNLNVKMNSSVRAPRSGAGLLPKLSALGHQTNSPNDWELSQCTNKLPASVGPSNRKRTPSARSSSPPVAQWAGQRPQKISRTARRTNFVPIVSSQDDTPASGSPSDGTGNENGLGFARRMSSSSQQVKPKVENFASATLSESEESVALETKSREKGKKFDDMDEKAAPSQKTSTLLLASRKNKLVMGDELGDGVRRQGRTGRGLSSTRSPMRVDKLGGVGTGKQLRTARHGFDKTESKAGRPPTRKLSDRRAYMRQKHTTINSTPDFLDDGHEELVAAANAVISSAHVSSSPFWRQMEQYFGLLSDADIKFLKEQGNLEPTAATRAPISSDVEGSNCVPNGVQVIENRTDTSFQSQPEGVEIVGDQLAFDLQVNNGISLWQRLITAMIPEEDEEFCCSENENLNYDSYGDEFEVDRDLKPDSSTASMIKGQSVAYDGYNLTSSVRSRDALEHAELERNSLAFQRAESFSKVGHSLNGVIPEQTTVTSMACSEFQNDSMLLDETLRQVLQGVGISPDPVHDISWIDGEEITQEISKLQDAYNDKVSEKKRLANALLMPVEEARKLQEKEFEQQALDKLIGMAYGKYMTYWGPNASGGKSASSKVAKQASFLFVQRTLERCHTFKDTGKSCFSEPLFKEMFLSGLSHLSDTQSGEISTDDKSIKPYEIAAGHSLEASLGSRQSPSRTSRLGLNMDNHDIYSSDVLTPLDHSSEQTTGREDGWSHRVKKRELSLDVVGGALGSSGASPGIGSSLPSSTKGKRSDRDREGRGYGREVLSRNGTAKVGRPPTSNIKGERKSKAKPKQKTTQLSASGSGILGKVTDQPKDGLSSVPKSREMSACTNVKEKDDFGLAMLDDPLDLSNLQLPGMDALDVPDDLGGQGQDIGSWLNIDEDGLQDHDFMGLEIPMDDLSDLNMMV
ncbi:hypothetical protein RJ641_025893 [Dillenia turbinata]|uniref:Uncharacterized protein n=1 Tax=Dillenia turbinata TaxID=194707 RepID=A0AAN8ZP01_9MAGN